MPSPMSFKPLSTISWQQMPLEVRGLAPSQPGLDIEPRYSVAAVWREVLQGMFSVLGRLASLAGYRDCHTGRYHHQSLTKQLGPEQANYGLRAAHALVWRDWICGSLEAQHSDILLYLNHLPADTDRLFALWLESKPFMAYPPDSASQQERFLFANNLTFLLELLQKEYCCERFGTQGEAKKPNPGVIEQVVSFVHRQYADPNLSLKLLSADVGLCERYIGRQFRELTGKAFRQYLRDLRIQEAATLLVHSDCDVKTIAAKVGYSDRSHFCEDFRVLMGCKPLEFRAKHSQAGGSDDLSLTSS